MALDFVPLETEIARDATVNTSASDLITSLNAQIELGKQDQVKLQAQVDALKANNDALQAAVDAANAAAAVRK